MWQDCQSSPTRTLYPRFCCSSLMQAIPLSSPRVAEHPRTAILRSLCCMFIHARAVSYSSSRRDRVCCSHAPGFFLVFGSHSELEAVHFHPRIVVLLWSSPCRKLGCLSIRGLCKFLGVFIIQIGSLIFPTLLAMVAVVFLMFWGLL